MLDERVVPYFDPDHLPQQEVVPPESLVRLGSEHALHEGRVEKPGPPESGRCQEFMRQWTEILPELLDRIERKPPLPFPEDLLGQNAPHGVLQQGLRSPSEAQMGRNAGGKPDQVQIQERYPGFDGVGHGHGVLVVQQIGDHFGGKLGPQRLIFQIFPPITEVLVVLIAGCLLEAVEKLGGVDALKERRIEVPGITKEQVVAAAV
jgi:hypothetical protein